MSATKDPKSHDASQPGDDFADEDHGRDRPPNDHYREAAKRFFAGARANVVQHAVLIAGHLALVPLFVSHWGDQAYGAWLLLAAFTGWLTLADLGLSTSAQNAIADAAARGDRDELTRRIRSTLRATTTLAVAVTLASAILAGVAARWQVLQIPGMDGLGTAFAVLFLGLAAAATLPQGLLCGMYRAVGEYARGVTIHTAFRACILALTAAAILLGGGILVVAAIHASVAGVFLLGTTLDLRRRHKDLPIGIEGGELRYAARFIRPGLLFLVIQAAAMLSLQGSALLVGSISGAATLAVFGAMRTLANLCRHAFGNLGVALWSETTVLAARGDRDALATVHRIFGRALIAVAIAITATLAACGEEVFLSWTRGALPFDRLLFTALLLHLAQQAYWSTSATILLSWNRHRPVAALSMSASVLGLIVGAFLIRPFGPAALVFSLATAEALLCGVFLPIAADRAIRALPPGPHSSRERAYHADLLFGVLPLAAIATGTAMTTAELLGGHAAPVLRWFTIAVTTGAATAVATLFWLSRADRAVIRHAVAARLGSRPLAAGGESR